MCLCGAMLALCCTAAAAWLQVCVGPSAERASPGQRVVLEGRFGAGDPPLDPEQLQGPVGAPRRLPPGRGCPTAAAAGGATGGCVRLASELQGHLARLAAEVKRCLGSPEAEERPPRAEAASTNRTAQP
ncbi:unnamed protein product [Eretmochelys imbricata]